jgi:predicted dehydrogenase
LTTLLQLEKKMSNIVRLAVIGGHRGSHFKKGLELVRDKLALTAMCDLDEGVLAKCRETFPGIRTTQRFEEILSDPNVDAVLIATPMALHAKQSIQALRAGKSVLSEVIAATTLEECWELVEVAEQAKGVFMMAENYCYRRETMMINNMAAQNVFGELTFAEGGYIHDCRALMHYPDGTRTWRGQISGGQLGRANCYPTHSLGPVAQWLGINRTDRFLRTTTFVTRQASRSDYSAALLGKDHPDAKPEAWGNANDSASTLIETAKGRVISLRFDSASPRPHNMVHYGLQGNKGAFLSSRHEKEAPLVWIEGISKGSCMTRPYPENEWQGLWELADRFEHPRWKAHQAEAEKAGHGGGDFFVIEDFADAIINKTHPAIDVYDAVTWSCIAPLSAQNVLRNGQPLDVPDFMRGKTRETTPIGLRG